MVSISVQRGSVEKPGETAERLVRFRVQQVKNGAGKKRRAGLHPVIVESLAVRVDDHMHDVLHVLRLVHRAQPHLFERVVLDARAGGVGRIELEAELAHALARARGEVPVLALEVVDQRGVWPRQQGRHHHAYALAATRRRDDQDVTRTAIAQIPGTPPARTPDSEIDPDARAPSA